MSSDELRIFIGLHRVVNNLDRGLSKVHKEFGLTMGQFAVLEVLYHKGDMCVGEVKDKILSSSGTIPVIVRNLEKRNLITRTQDEDDKRKTILSLTDEGYDLIEEAYPVNEEKIKEEISVLSRSEMFSLVNILKKLDKSFEEG